MPGSRWFRSNLFSVVLQHTARSRCYLVELSGTVHMGRVLRNSLIGRSKNSGQEETEYGIRIGCSCLTVFFLSPKWLPALLEGMCFNALEPLTLLSL